VAVSAPFGGTGRVFVYFGEKGKVQLRTLLYIIIEASPMGDVINGFGTTLLGKVDLDGNGTPGVACRNKLNSK